VVCGGVVAGVRLTSRRHRAGAARAQSSDVARVRDSGVARAEGIRGGIGRAGRRCHHHDAGGAATRAAMSDVVAQRPMVILGGLPSAGFPWVGSMIGRPAG
jgi:hypothetical protein